MASKSEDVKSLPLVELRKRLDQQKRLLQNKYEMMNNFTLDFRRVYSCILVTAMISGCHATEILVASDCSPCSLALDSHSVRACSQ